MRLLFFWANMYQTPGVWVLEGLVFITQLYERDHANNQFTRPKTWELIHSNSPILGAGTNELRWVGMVSVSAFSLKVTSGGSILWADSKVICCFLIETTKYCVYLVVFARNTEFCWKNKNFDFLKTGVKTLLKTRKFHKKLTFFVCMLVENRCFHFFEKHEITLLWGIQNSKIL